MDTFLNAIINILPEESRDIDRDLLTLAFLSQRNQDLLSKKQFNRLIKTYGITTYESLEFFGDGILEIILKHMIYQALSTQSPGAMSRVISLLRSNNFLACLIGKYNICIVNKEEEISPKFCADLFEALLAAIFLDLINKGLDAYRITYRWLAEFWEIPKYIDIFISGRPDPCFVSNKILPPSVDLSQVSVPVNQLPELDLFSYASNLDPSDLNNLIVALNQVLLEKTISLNPEQTLSDMFQRLGLRQPRYILSQPTGVIVPCPIEICPSGGFLGSSQNPNIIQARQEAARQSIDTLRNMGLINF